MGHHITTFAIAWYDKSKYERREAEQQPIVVIEEETTEGGKRMRIKEVREGTTVIVEGDPDAWVVVEKELA